MAGSQQPEVGAFFAGLSAPCLGDWVGSVIQMGCRVELLALLLHPEHVVSGPDINTLAVALCSSFISFQPCSSSYTNGMCVTVGFFKQIVRVLMVTVESDCLDSSPRSSSCLAALGMGNLNFFFCEVG